MLKRLYIKNFAIIHEIEINFNHGLNIITGETGAGKSIIVDALMLALGERASIDFVKHGERKSVIEAIFVLPAGNSIFELLNEHDLDLFDNELIIRREVNSKGGSRAFINDSPVQLNILKQVGEYLVDFHGQHDHQSLLRSENHIEMLDQYGTYGILLTEYKKLYQELNKYIYELNSLIKKEQALRAREEFQRFQLNEINAVLPEEDEDRRLEEELQKLENAELLFNNSQQVNDILYDNSESAHNKLSRAIILLSEMSRYDSKINDYIEELKSALVISDEVAKYASNYKEDISFSSERIDEIRNRLNKIKILQKKYGSIEFILQKQKELKQELDLIDNFDEEIKKLRNQINEIQKSAGAKAGEISSNRSAVSEKLSSGIEKILFDLGIENAVFKVNINFDKTEKYRNDTVIIDNDYFIAHPDGIDKVEFYISTNKGEIPKPLASVASGGEVSRIMLAIKSLLAGAESTPLLVFDEIDTGISGRIAQKVAHRMKELSEYHQIICITHLPQIASMGDNNYYVEKLEKNGATSANIRKLNNEEKLYEIAKMISGEDISDAALNNAKELLNFSKIKK